jgi:DNA-binding transcriptional MerR regulator
MHIGELAKRFGLNPKTIRYYETIGLLPGPSRTASGYRRYDEAAASLVEFIQRAKRLGLSLQEIRGVLAIRERGEQPCEHVLALVDAELTRIDQRIVELMSFRAELKALRGRWTDEAPRLADASCLCPIIEDGSDVDAAIADHRLSATRSGRLSSLAAAS